MKTITASIVAEYAVGTPTETAAKIVKYAENLARSGVLVDDGEKLAIVRIDDNGAPVAADYGPSRILAISKMIQALTLVSMDENSCLTPDTRRALHEAIKIAHQAFPEGGPRLYAASCGNGNDGVSRLYPNLLVLTDDPWRLASLTMIHQFTLAATREYVAEAVEVDGEALYGITAMVMEGPDGETQFGAAWQTVEVYLAGDAVSDRWEGPTHLSLEACFGAEFLKEYPAED